MHFGIKQYHLVKNIRKSPNSFEKKNSSYACRNNTTSFSKKI